MPAQQSRQLVVATLLILTGAVLGAQGRPAAGTSTLRTPWGDPNVQGTWDYWTFTPLERPNDVAPGTVLSDAEASRLADQLRDRAFQNERVARAGDPGAYGQAVWTDRARATALNQSAIIVDPADGKIPALTEDAKRQAEAHRAAGGRPVRIRTGGVGTDGPEDRGVAERCILGFSTGPPMLPAGYNNNIQIFQTRDFVAILLEMNHDARIIPLDGRPHLPVGMRQWMGDSRGRWEGNTLVVETTNFTDKTASIALTGFWVGSAEKLTLVEKFTRVDADTLTYEFTVNDPGTFTRPFTGRLPMNLTNERIYEYACHEGNYGMFNMLSGARAEEQSKK